MIVGTPASRIFFQRDSLDQRSDADFVPSRGRPAARDTMSDAHSRKTTVSFGPLQPIFQQGVFDKLLEQRERRAELWRRPKKGPSSAAFASQWRQPSPLVMTHMRWPTEAIRAQSRGVSPFCVGGREALVHQTRPLEGRQRKTPDTF